MADDIADLMKYLRIEKADVMGYSLGGGVALRTALQRPNMIRKLMIVSAAFKCDGWYPKILAAMAQAGWATAAQMKQSPIYQTYRSRRAEPGRLARTVHQARRVAKQGL